MYSVTILWVHHFALICQACSYPKYRNLIIMTDLLCKYHLILPMCRPQLSDEELISSNETKLHSHKCKILQISKSTHVPVTHSYNGILDVGFVEINFDVFKFISKTSYFLHGLWMELSTPHF